MSPPPSPGGREADARIEIDAALETTGWVVQNCEGMNLSVAQGVAIREFKLKHGHGYADYLMFVDAKAVGGLEAKAPGHILITRNLGTDYFDELFEHVLQFRASERRCYQKITDVYARYSVDYYPRSDITKTLYATVQNATGSWQRTSTSTRRSVCARGHVAIEGSSHVGI